MDHLQFILSELWESRSLQTSNTHAIEVRGLLSFLELKMIEIYKNLHYI